MGDVGWTALGIAFVLIGVALGRETWVQIESYRRTGHFRRSWIIPEGSPRWWALTVWTVGDLMLIAFGTYLVVVSADG
jgi:hypothetical protein